MDVYFPNISIYYFLVLIPGILSVKNGQIIIPPIVQCGDTVSLACLYELEKGPLYTIKWYLNDQEFYQYVPESEQPQNSYLIWKDMKIDVSNSDSHEVTLLNVSREMTGYYKCEITEDYPSYHTVILGGRMQVVVVPEEKPLLILGRPRPSPGDKMIANCTSGAAYPAPNITWTINGSPKNDTLIIRREVTGINQLWESTSEFELELSSDHFQNGQLRLACFATIDGVYTSSAETIITEDKPLIASITGDASPHNHGANSASAPISRPPPVCTCIHPYPWKKGWPIAVYMILLSYFCR
ncbi:uncharacterized protein [Fopius arisanus]|uniref:Cd300c protein n=1 Tax=Fopius arisanus TaxID=64838 RepID=A0A0C9QQA6_9HYME|nr:PREDICTED: uncharacterized protein LOC105272802 [Fopius arisanus]